MADYSPSRHPEFHYKTEFQSHEPEVSFKNFVSGLLMITISFYLVCLPSLLDSGI